MKLQHNGNEKHPPFTLEEKNEVETEKLGVPYDEKKITLGEKTYKKILCVSNNDQEEGNYENAHARKSFRNINIVSNNATVKDDLVDHNKADGVKVDDIHYSSFNKDDKNILFLNDDYAKTATDKIYVNDNNDDGENDDGENDDGENDDGENDDGENDNDENDNDENDNDENDNDENDNDENDNDENDDDENDNDENDNDENDNDENDDDENDDDDDDDLSYNDGSYYNNCNDDDATCTSSINKSVRIINNSIYKIKNNLSNIKNIVNLSDKSNVDMTSDKSESDDSSLVRTYENLEEGNDEECEYKKNSKDLDQILKTVINRKKEQKNFTVLDIIDECISIGDIYSTNRQNQDQRKAKISMLRDEKVGHTQIRTESTSPRGDHVQNSDCAYMTSLENAVNLENITSLENVANLNIFETDKVKACKSHDTVTASTNSESVSNFHKSKGGEDHLKKELLNNCMSYSSYDISLINNRLEKKRKELVTCLNLKDTEEESTNFCTTNINIENENINKEEKEKAKVKDKNKYKEEEKDKDKDEEKDKDRDEVKDKNKDEVKDKNKDEVKDKNKDEVKDKNKDEEKDKNKYEEKDKNKDEEKDKNKYEQKDKETEMGNLIKCTKGKNIYRVFLSLIISSTIFKYL
ncbi:conserved Plasmodium protein, unknown function [Plasmodium malariae]|uniref:Uncharacterized protein n=1 Tax=Plasmodium malariae TaxID=5858 RepID=A0A1A8X0Z9_PLAMA|nr:conserved Plasmodium protein, unknown function [Plasmodium malariae]